MTPPRTPERLGAIALYLARRHRPRLPDQRRAQPSGADLRTQMAQACKRAGIGHVAPHSLRRWAATTVAATGDMKAAQEMLGHVAASMTADVYASPTGASRKRAADAVEEALG